MPRSGRSICLAAICRAGWVMLAAMTYSIIPPLIIGLEGDAALDPPLQDEVIHTDAKMNKANWMTGAAGLFGVLGLGLGWWWADSAAAAIISFDIILDGWKALKVATAELVDGVPRELGGTGPDPEAEKLIRKLERQFPGGESAFAKPAAISTPRSAGSCRTRRRISRRSGRAPRRRWRLAQLSFVPPNEH